MNWEAKKKDDSMMLNRRWVVSECKKNLFKKNKYLSVELDDEISCENKDSL